MSKKIWFDFTNPPHTHNLYPILKYFLKNNYKVFSTAKNFAETIELLKLKDIEFRVVGEHAGGSRIKKLSKMLVRDLSLLFSLPKFDYCITCGIEGPQVSWLRHKKSIIFDDNDIFPNYLYSKFVSYVFSPEVVNVQKMVNWGIKRNKIITYPGLKENLYIADFQKDKNFLLKIPYRNFVVVRPENIFASYVKPGTKSIVPELLDSLIKKKINTIFLPRYAIDKDYAPKSEFIHIPKKPLNGLDLCYYSDAILTGAGTFSREAAVFGTPAVSFYAGTEFLSVDKHLINQKKIFFSRDVNDIINYLYKSKKQIFDQSDSKHVLNFILERINKIIES